MKKGDIVKYHTDDQGSWVPALVTADGWVTVFPGPAKDDENLQAAANEVQASEGDKRGDISPL